MAARIRLVVLGLYEDMIALLPYYRVHRSEALCVSNLANMSRIRGLVGPFTIAVTPRFFERCEDRNQIMMEVQMRAVRRQNSWVNRRIPLP